MENTISYFLSAVDTEFLRKHTRTLMKLELPQTFPAMEKASNYAFNLLQEEGFDAELIAFPGDGKTSYQDKIMPMAWDASYGRLSVVTDWEGEPVIADYEKEPFSLIRYSVSTPENGLTTQLIPWERMRQGEDVSGAMILLPQGLFPTDEALVPILNAGAIGLVNGTCRGAALAPDCTHWANNCTETNSWYVNADERPFIGFCVTPRIRDALETACSQGEVLVKAETDAHRYEGTIWGVTALLKGETNQELWLTAHLTEPLEDDNSAGVVCGIEILRMLRRAIKDGRLSRLKYGVRVLFAPELYGFAALAEHFGGVLKDRCIGGLNMDGMPLAKIHPVMRLVFAAPAVPFYGNAVMEAVGHVWNERICQTPYVAGWDDHYDDDCFLSDGSVGCPMLMPMHPNGIFWHNSRQRDEYVDYEQFARVAAMYASFAALTSGAEPEQINRLLLKASAYAQARLADLASYAPPRAGTDAHERMQFWTEVEIRRIQDFARADADPELIQKAKKQVQCFADELVPLESPADIELPSCLMEAAEWIPERTLIGTPHDLANVPKEKRWHPLSTRYGNLILRVFSDMDGQKTLKELIIQAEWEERRCWSEQTIESFIATMCFLANYGYVKLKKVNIGQQ